MLSVQMERRMDNAAGMKAAGTPAGERATVQNHIHAQLREALATGQWDPGQKLTIDQLARSFETSHTPVREALRRLASEGALDISAGGTARIPAIDAHLLDDLSQARTVVEGALAAEAAVRATSEDIDALEMWTSRHEAAAENGNVMEMLDHNRNFHMRLYQIAAMPTLSGLADTLWLRYGPFMGMLSRHILPVISDGRGRAYTGHHRSIIQAIKLRNRALCELELRADICATQELLRPLCAQWRPGKSGKPKLTEDPKTQHQQSEELS